MQVGLPRFQRRTALRCQFSTGRPGTAAQGQETARQQRLHDLAQVLVAYQPHRPGAVIGDLAALAPRPDLAEAADWRRAPEPSSGVSTKITAGSLPRSGA